MAEEFVSSLPLLVFGYLEQLFGPRKSCYELFQATCKSKGAAGGRGRQRGYKRGSKFARGDV